VQHTELKLISSQVALPLRHKILRPHQTIQDCVFPQDAWSHTFHVGGFHEGQLIGVATFHEESFPELSAQKPWRLRGMATDSTFHGRGIGRKVLEFGMDLLKLKQCDLLWCNAREVAFPFYEKLGFEYLGPMFEIPTVGPHKVMYKYLV
jgi:GNAT superfamily N-acetyltransferase